MRIPTLLPVVLVLAATDTTLTAQCLFTSVAATPSGHDCNAASTGFCRLAAFPSTLVPVLDTGRCALDVTVTAFEGCGATVPLRLLAIGLQPTFVPLPQFGAACALQVDPIGILMTTGPSFVVTLPPATTTFAFEAQGVAWSHFPWSPTPDVLAFTAPYSIRLQ